MFQVFNGSIDDGDLVAEIDGEYDCWKNSKYDTFEDAVAYAKSWLGMYYNGQEIKLNEKFFYYYKECWIIIKEVA